MIKDVVIQKEITEHHKFCDVCGVEVVVGLKCHALTCQYCKKDLCYDCTSHMEGLMDDYSIVWCEECWKLGQLYRQEIDELNGKISQLHDDWKRDCGIKE